MIFLDTSAIFALADAQDSNHNQALDLFGQALGTGEEILVHNYVVVESAALLQRRLGLNTSLRFLDETQAFQIHWISSTDHEQAVTLLNERSRLGLSLDDCASFVVTRRFGVSHALAFDSAFEQEGFITYSGL